MLFDCASNRDATIESMLLHQNDGVDWNATFGLS